PDHPLGACRIAETATGPQPAARTYVRFRTCRPLSMSFCSNVASGCLTHIASTALFRHRTVAAAVRHLTLLPKATDAAGANVAAWKCIGGNSPMSELGQNR